MLFEIHKVRHHVGVSKLILALGVFACAIPQFASAKAELTVSRTVNSASIQSEESTTLRCAKDRPDLKDCHLIRIESGTLQNIDRIVDAKTANEILRAGAERLGKYSGTPIAANGPSLRWSIDFQGKTFSGGTKTKDSGSRKNLISSLLALESRMMQESAQ